MMLLDYFVVFGGFLKKWTKLANLGNFEVLRRGVGIPCSGVAEREAWKSSGTLRRSKAMPRRKPTPQLRSAMPWRSTVHRHVFLSRFAIPLFRELIYWTNEDPISV